VLPDESPAPVVPEEDPYPVTTARLVDSASRLKWSSPKPEAHRKLGAPRPWEVPENWRPSIRLDENLFDGMTLPVKTEIVDEWLAADGSQNVVLNTPTGQAMCGRREASDPLRPMVENLMMFRPCGDGGQRPFKMPDRFSKHLVD
jgi:hypothetical protein